MVVEGHRFDQDRLMEDHEDLFQQYNNLPTRQRRLSLL